jgi:imidazolonepropionase-like amidohydrolase
MTGKQRLAMLKRRDEILAEVRAERLTEEAAAALDMPAGEPIVGVRRMALANARLEAEGKPLDDQEAFAEAVAAVGPQPDDVTILAAPAAEQEASEGDELVTLAQKRLSERGILEPTQDELFEALSGLTGGKAA